MNPLPPAVGFKTEIPTSICNANEKTACSSYCCVIISEKCFPGTKTTGNSPPMTLTLVVLKDTTL